MAARSKWAPAHTIGYRPDEVVKLEVALNELHMMTVPHMTSSLSSVGSQSGEWNDSMERELDVRGFYRGKLKAFLGEIDVLVKKISNVSTPLPEEIREYEKRKGGRRRGWHCPSCRTGQRPQARRCDQCGAWKPDEEAAG